MNAQENKRNLTARRLGAAAITSLLALAILVMPALLLRTVAASPSTTSTPGATVPVEPGNTYSVTVVDDSGPGSFRQAILDTNSNPGTDTIAFSIPGSGVHTIYPLSSLPTISDPVVIDGYTQPGSSPNTLSVGDNATISIELNGTNAGFEVNGLTITAGTSTVRGLVVNNFRKEGISLQGAGGSTIQGNFIGTNPAGTAAQPNSYYGIEVGVDQNESDSNIIGGTQPAARNLISGNGYSGVEIIGTGNQVMGNYMGTDATGNYSVPNSGSVLVMGYETVIGGTAPGAGNLMSGNRYSGLDIQAFAYGTILQGNLIGTNATGTMPNPNGGDGVWFFDSLGAEIGGDTPGARNVICSNSGAGVHIQNSSDVTIYGNNIGVGADGLSALGNGLSGVLVEGSNHNDIGVQQVGGGNIIAHNGQVGVLVTWWGGVEDITGNRITSNSIFDNASLGIALGTGAVVPNDACDPDGGPNDFQNFPVLAAAASTTETTTISGSLNSTANRTFTIEFFGSPTGDPSGYGEGATYLGSIQVTTDAGCDVTFYATLPVSLPAGTYVTATAIEAGGDTSEFSQYVISTQGTAATVTPGPSHTPTPTPTPTPPLCDVFSPSVSTNCQAPPNLYRYDFYAIVYCSHSIEVSGTLNLYIAPSESGPWTFWGDHPVSGSLDPYSGHFYQYFSESPIPPQYGFYRVRADVHTSNGQSFSVTSSPTLACFIATPTRTPTATWTPTATPTRTPCANGFRDVPPGSTFYDYVMCLASRGIISGYPDCTFKPNNTATRGQIAKIVSNAAGFADDPGGQIFQDVPPGSTFYTWVNRVAIHSVVSGYPCGGPGEPCNPPGNLPYFRPGGTATRGQISKIVSNAAGFHDPPGAQIFEDVPPSSPFYDFIYRLTSRGVMNGYPCGGPGEPCNPPANLPYFRPGKNATRGQIAKIVANTFFPTCQGYTRH